MSTRKPTGAAAAPDAVPNSRAPMLTNGQYAVSAGTPKLRIVPRVYCSRWLPASWSLVPRTVIGGALT
jgi:hypothetical protein